jgi:uncharacterized membrane protein YesL
VNGRLYAAISWLSRTIGLSLLWLLASLPVVTVPAATVGLFAVVRRWSAGDEPALLPTFGAAFRRELRRASAVGAIWAAVGLVLVVDLLAVRRLPGSLAFVGVPLLGLAFVVYALASAYVFPLLVLSSGGWHHVLRNAVLLAIGRPWAALGPAVLFVSSVVLVVFVPVLALVWAGVMAMMTYRSCAPAVVRALQVPSESELTNRPTGSRPVPGTPSDRRRWLWRYADGVTPRSRTNSFDR